MQQIVESIWPRGWIPSAAAKGSLAGDKALGLLRMDNLNLDEEGLLRISKASDLESSALASAVNSIFSSNLNISGTNRKLRYIYDASGNLNRNYGAAVALKTFDKNIFTGGSTKKCRFLNQLGHIFAIAGTQKYRDRGDVSGPLGLPKPSAPTVVANSPVTIDLANLDGSSKFTNWSSVASTAFVNNQAYMSITSYTTTPVGNGHFGICQTIFGSPFDTTNLGGTNNATDNDIFSFKFLIDDPSQLISLRVEFLCEAPTGSTTVPDTLNAYWFEWDFQNVISTELVKTDTTFSHPKLGNGNVVSLVSTGKSTGLYDWILQAGPNNWTEATITRSQFNRMGADTTKDWSNIKAIRITYTVLGKISSGIEVETTMTFKDFKFIGGKTSSLSGDFQYAAVQVRNTGNYLEFSPMSDPTATISLSMQSTTVTPSGAVNGQANQYWVFRIDNTTGIYYHVKDLSGADGFTPGAFSDNLSVSDMLLAAASNPLYKLEYYRNSLPDDIIGMIWFADRVIYLTSKGFIPSFKLDPGSYDSRFVYELCGDNAETCLFIAKIDIGTFLVATTRDFYRVTGKFSTIDTGSSILLDVNIYAMGITDPAISSEFIEKDGSIIYISATGIRALNSSTSILMNRELDLLFRNETRYALAPLQLLPYDQSLIACATQGTRLYFSLPDSGGNNKIYVSTSQNGNLYWRLLDNEDNPRCMYREEDGTIIYGTSSFLKSLETINGPLQVHLLTQYNFGRSPTNRKDPLLLRFYGNTGAVPLTLVVRALKHDGTVATWNTTLTLNNNTVDLDLKYVIEPSLAYAVEIYGTVIDFSLDHFVLQYEPRAPLVRRMILYATNFKKPNKKKFSSWPVLIDPLGSNVTINVKADDVQLPPSVVTGDGIRTLYWYNLQDIAATDWEMELVSDEGFEHYSWLSPDFLQIFPNDRLWDQVGPIDFNKKGLVFGIRFRLYCTSALVHYEVFDGDNLVYENDIENVLINKDQVYLMKFPKGIDPSVCKVVLTSDKVFNRFSAEFKVRITGNETEDTFVKL